MFTSLTNQYAALLKSSTPKTLPRLHCQILKLLSPLPTFLSNSLITAYSNSRLPSHARKVFDLIPHPTPFSWNALLSAYAANSLLPAMHRTFLSIPSPDHVSWNCLLSAYTTHRLPSHALRTYLLMLHNAVPPSRITFSTLLILSAGIPTLGKQIHCHILKFGFQSYPFVGSPLLDMYCKSGLVTEAKQAFNQMLVKNVVVYNTMITGLLRCGMVEDGKRLFAEMGERDSISWTTMLTGLVQNGLEVEAVAVFREMRLGGVGIDQYTFGSVLTACGGLAAMEYGRQIHGYIVRTGYEDNVFVGSALLDMYCKCKNIRDAELVFWGMPVKNVVTWTAMIVGYGQSGCGEEAVRVFTEMQRSGVMADDYTLGSVISSCANLASLEEGAQFHCQTVMTGLISYQTVSNAIVTLYGKCGSIEDAQKLFNEMLTRDQVSWTALVTGYAQFGKAKETIELFERMLADRIRPDGVTFIGVLSACSRAGLVDEGYRYFESMKKDHGIVPQAEHYTCMIDLLSRTGRLTEAEDFIKQMPCRPDAIGWSTLLSACRLRGNMVIGKWAAESLLELEPQNPASYVLLTSMHAARGNWDEVVQLRTAMRVMGVKKEPGYSWIKYKNTVHTFSADDQSHRNSALIYAELEKLNAKMLEEGYKADTSSILHDVGEAAKVDMINHHSERLAIAFGLIFIPRELPIRVVKNLRVCVDCHNATKIISKIVGREILVRDSVRFHKFSEGVCSCGDFW